MPSPDSATLRASALDASARRQLGWAGLAIACALVVLGYAQFEQRSRSAEWRGTRLKPGAVVETMNNGVLQLRSDGQRFTVSLQATAQPLQMVPGEVVTVALAPSRGLQVCVDRPGGEVCYGLDTLSSAALQELVAHEPTVEQRNLPGGRLER